jgi:hypothetical protein
LGEYSTGKKEAKRYRGKRIETANLGHDTAPLLHATKPRLGFGVRDPSLHAANSST